eukprot:1658122-Pleurochrysis_carterae.AAC.2
MSDDDDWDDVDEADLADSSQQKAKKGRADRKNKKGGGARSKSKRHGSAHKEQLDKFDTSIGIQHSDDGFSD